MLAGTFNQDQGLDSGRSLEPGDPTRVLKRQGADLVELLGVLLGEREVRCGEVALVVSQLGFECQPWANEKWL